MADPENCMHIQYFISDPLAREVLKKQAFTENLWVGKMVIADLAKTAKLARKATRMPAISGVILQARYRAGNAIPPHGMLSFACLAISDETKHMGDRYKGHLY